MFSLLQKACCFLCGIFFSLTGRSPSTFFYTCLPEHIFIEIWHIYSQTYQSEVHHWVNLCCCCLCSSLFSCNFFSDQNKKHSEESSSNYSLLKLPETWAYRSRGVRVHDGRAEAWRQEQKSQALNRKRQRLESLNSQSPPLTYFLQQTHLLNGPNSTTN